MENKYTNEQVRVLDLNNDLDKTVFAKWFNENKSDDLKELIDTDARAIMLYATEWRQPYEAGIIMVNDRMGIRTKFDDLRTDIDFMTPRQFIEEAHKTLSDRTKEYDTGEKNYRSVSDENRENTHIRVMLQNRDLLEYDMGMIDENELLERQRMGQYSLEPNTEGVFERTVQFYDENESIAAKQRQQALTMQITENNELDRLQIKFSSKPQAEVLTALKKNGWHWSTREFVWQRKLTDNARRDAETFRQKFFPEEEYSEEPKAQSKHSIDNEEDFNKALDLVCSYKDFDNALDAHKAGQLPDGYVFNLGKPGEILQKCGFPEHHNIELSASHLQYKMNLERHPFTTDDIKGLDKALQNPVAVFEYRNDKSKHQNVIVELQKDGKNFLAGVHFNQSQRGIAVSNIRGLFHRENMDWIRWLEQGKMIYGDKEKIQALVAQQGSNFSELNNADARSSSDTYYLDSASSILQEFGDVKHIYTDEFKDYSKYKERYEVYKALDGYYKEMPFDRELIHAQTKELYEAWKNNDFETLHKYWVKEHELSETVRTFLANKDGEIYSVMEFYNYATNGKVQENTQPQEQTNEQMFASLGLKRASTMINQETASQSAAEQTFDAYEQGIRDAYEEEQARLEEQDEETEWSDADIEQGEYVTALQEAWEKHLGDNSMPGGEHPTKEFEDEFSKKYYAEKEQELDGYEAHESGVLFTRHESLAYEETEESILETNKEMQLTEKDLALAKQIIPQNQYALMLKLTQEEEGEYFKGKIKEIAATAERLYGISGENKNADGTHPLELHYIDKRKNFHWYLSELSEDGIGNGYLLTGNNDPFGNQWEDFDVTRLAASPDVELDIHVKSGMTIEQAIGITEIPIAPRDESLLDGLTETQNASYNTIEENAQEASDNARGKDIREGEQLRGENPAPRTGMGEEWDNAGNGEGAAGTNGGDGEARGADAGAAARPSVQGQPAELFDAASDGSGDGAGGERGTGAHAGELPRDAEQLSGRLTKSQAKDLREECRSILAKPDAEITKDDLAVLKQYEGAGGLHEQDATTHGVLSEFYTPQNIIHATWQLANSYAPDARTVLEPSAGTGRFARDILAQGKRFTMHELDETSARIAKLLHPEANIIVGAYQKQFFDENERALNKNYEQPKYDLVIGNPPYGEYKDKYKGLGEGREFDRYEEYFISKGLDALKDENSILAMVVPSGFLNSARDRQKGIIAEKGVLLDAYRLPEGAFPSTKVGTDIVLFRKAKADEKSEFLNDVRATVLSDNKWFSANPEHVLGEVRTRTNRSGKEESYVALPEGKTLDDMLSVITQDVEARSAERAKMREQFMNMGKDFGEAINNIVEEEQNKDDTSIANNDVEVETKETIETAERIYGGETTLDAGIVSSEKRKARRYSWKDNKTDAIDLIHKYNLNYGNSDMEFTIEDKNGNSPKIFFGRNTEFYEENNNLIIDYANQKTVVNSDGLIIENPFNPQEESSVNNPVAKEQAVQNAPKQSEAVISKPAVTQAVQAEKLATEISADDEEIDERYKYRDEHGTFATDKILSASDFSGFYKGEEMTAEDFAIWSHTDFEGKIKADGLSKAEIERLATSEKYIRVDINSYMNRELYTSGDIISKLNALESKKQNMPADVYESCKKALTEAKPEHKSLETVHISPLSNIASKFEVERDRWENVSAYDYRHGHHTRCMLKENEKLPLKEDFIDWATGHGLTEDFSNSRYWITNWTEASIQREDIPDNISWRDIVEYIEETPVRAKSAPKDRPDLKNKYAAEAEEKRQARKATAEKLFNKYINEGLPHEQRARLETEWNRVFNSTREADYSKLPLAIDGMRTWKDGEKFILLKQQVKGVSYLMQKGNGILAYDVGVGKTATGIVATVGQIQTGRAKRPLIVVPKAVYTKWAHDIKELFPEVPLNELGNLSAQAVKGYDDGNSGLKIPEGSISICTEEALQRITFENSSIEGPLFYNFSNLLGKSVEARSSDPRTRARVIDGIIDVIGEASKVKDGYVFFERCGFDNITVDEAHRYKNLFRTPRTSRPDEHGKANEFAGLGNGDPSARALKMFAMTQLVQDKNDSRNVFLLTATPFTNSPLEVYSMLSYVGSEALRRRGIYDLRDFCTEFAQTSAEWSVMPNGEIKPKGVMKQFNNVGALQGLLREYIDKVDGEEAGVVRPNKHSHKPFLEMTAVQKQIIEHETKRMNDPREIAKGGYLDALGKMRRACVSPALLNAADYPEIENFPKVSDLVESSPKLSYVCDTAASVWKAKPECGQIIYMPQGVTELAFMKEYLVQRGIPEGAIGTISGQEKGLTQEKIDDLCDKFNDKEHPMKILIGSKKIAEGMDLNGNSIALYNTMIDWNPTESLQVEGRIWRQGNAQESVHIVYPLMEDSVESLLMQKHDEKSSRINNLFDYTGGDALDVSAINPEELKFDLIKDPQLKAEYILSQMTSDLERQKAVEEARVMTFEEIYTGYKDTLNSLELNRYDVDAYEKKILDPNYVDDIIYFPPRHMLSTYIENRKKEIKKMENKLSSLDKKLGRLGIEFGEEATHKEKEALAREAVSKHEARKTSIEKNIEELKSHLPQIIEEEKRRVSEQKSMSRPVTEQIAEMSIHIVENTRERPKKNRVGQKAAPSMEKPRQQTKAAETLKVETQAHQQVKQNKPVMLDSKGNGVLFADLQEPDKNINVSSEDTHKSHTIINIPDPDFRETEASMAEKVIPKEYKILKDDYLREAGFVPPMQVKNGRVSVYVETDKLDGNFAGSNKWDMQVKAAESGLVELIMSKELAGKMTETSMLESALAGKKVEPLSASATPRQYADGMKKAFPGMSAEEIGKAYRKSVETINKSMANGISFDQKRSIYNGVER